MASVFGSETDADFSSTTFLNNVSSVSEALTVIDNQITILNTSGLPNSGETAPLSNVINNLNEEIQNLSGGLDPAINTRLNDLESFQTSQLAINANVVDELASKIDASALAPYRTSVDQDIIDQSQNNSISTLQDVFNNLLSDGIDHPGTTGGPVVGTRIWDVSSQARDYVDNVLSAPTPTFTPPSNGRHDYFPENGNLIIVYTDDSNNQTLLRTATYGASSGSLGSPYPGNEIRMLSWDRTANRLFVMFDDRVYSSTTQGNTWELEIDGNNYFPALQFRHIQMNRDNPNINFYYVHCTDNSIAYREPAGAVGTWSRFFEGGAVDSVAPLYSIIYVGGQYVLLGNSSIGIGFISDTGTFADANTISLNVGNFVRYTYSTDNTRLFVWNGVDEFHLSNFDLSDFNFTGVSGIQEMYYQANGELLIVSNSDISTTTAPFTSPTIIASDTFTISYPLFLPGSIVSGIDITVNSGNVLTENVYETLQQLSIANNENRSNFSNYKTIASFDSDINNYSTTTQTQALIATSQAAQNDTIATVYETKTDATTKFNTLNSNKVETTAFNTATTTLQDNINTKYDASNPQKFIKYESYLGAHLTGSPPTNLSYPFPGQSTTTIRNQAFAYACTVKAMHLIARANSMTTSGATFTLRRAVGNTPTALTMNLPIGSTNLVCSVYADVSFAALEQWHILCDRTGSSGTGPTDFTIVLTLQYD